MDVDNVSFYPLLLDLLTDISEAHFVAIDLELSGVVTKGANNGTGKPSLQHRYLETKEAAERYQILQFGVTCVSQDVASQKYIFKPYNFDICPIIAEKGVDIERIFSFQSGAAEFLLKTGFDLARPFKHGVPYLSRAETREARDKHAKRQDKSAMADIQIKPTEIESLAFLQRVRDELSAWLISPTAAATNYVNIAPVGAETINDGEAADELSRYEKRLVHQLVRAEYPDLVTVSKRGFIQVIRYDKEREDKITESRKRDSDERIARQKGFRWVLEALLGSNLTGIDLRECARDPVSGEQIFADMDEFRARFNRAHNILRRNPRVIVGHNCFLDLVYIYRQFIGALPDTVEEFQQALHALWPTIIDTKYMSTHNCGDISPVSSLEQIATQLSEQETPVLEVAADHKKYEAVEAYHEAGYDSFLTAQIAVRLGSKLEAAGAYVDVGEKGSPSKKPGKNGTPKRKDTGWALAAPFVSQHTNGAPPPSANLAPDLATLTLTAPPEEPGFTPSDPTADWKSHGDPTIIGAADPFFVYDPRDRHHRYRAPQAAGHIEGGMPAFDADFWRVYGNKLRVFGTEEGVCGLSPPEEEEGVGQGGVQV
ncbi:hypothetical protein LTR53_015110 [Teratosphaeriaceae sp. CCFEE 6253]|nr:hypothetical protein LTR53_015110 [Teratosphaeriaceae sp. CCFEE 6253]